MLKSFCWLFFYFEFSIYLLKRAHAIWDRQIETVCFAPCGWQNLNADTFSPHQKRKIAICRQSVWNTESALNAIYRKGRRRWSEKFQINFSQCQGAFRQSFFLFFFFCALPGKNASVNPRFCVLLFVFVLIQTFVNTSQWLSNIFFSAISILSSSLCTHTKNSIRINTNRYVSNSFSPNYFYIEI